MFCVSAYNKGKKDERLLKQSEKKIIKYIDDLIFMVANNKIKKNTWKTINFYLRFLFNWTTKQKLMLRKMTNAHENKQQKKK